MKKLIAILIIATIFTACKDKIPNSPSVWIRTYHISEGHNRGEGHCYNNLVKMSDRKYLFLIKDLDDKVIDSTIITINE